jgi:hypothetical protein
MPDYGQGYRETYGDAYISARAGARVLHELVREDGIRFARLFPYPYFLTASSSSWDVLLYTETELNLSILDRARISQGYADVLWACVSASEAQSGSRGIADRLNYGALLERDIETVWAVDNFARRIFR